VAFEPIATPVFNAVGKLSESLAGLNIKKSVNEVQRFVKTNKDFKSVLNAVRVALGAFGAAAKFAFSIMKEQFRGAWTYVRGAMQALRGVVKVTSGLLTGNWSKAWKGVKDIFRGSVKVVLGVMRAFSAPLRAVTKKLAGFLAPVFNSAWEEVQGVFETGGNAVISVVNAVIKAINAIPGIPNIDTVGTINFGGDDSGSLSGANKGNLGRQKGGVVPGHGTGDSWRKDLPAGSYVLNRKATKAFGFDKGGTVKTILEPGERYFLPDEVRKVGADKLEMMNRSVSRFQEGGLVGLLNGGDVWGAAKGAANLAMKGPGFFIDKLPDPNIPEPLTGVGPYVVDAAKDWIKDKVNPFSGGGGNAPLGDSSGNLSTAMALATSMGLSITSTTGGTHAPGSYHYMGRAFDASNGSSPTSEMNAYALAAASQWGSKITELFYDPLGWYIKHGAKVPGAIGGHTDHVHTAFQKGGLVSLIRKMAGGGSVRVPTVDDHWDNDQLAALAHAVRMKNPGLMAQIANGESSGDPMALGDDAAAGYGNTYGYGLWQITSGYNDALIAAAGGPNKKGIYDPIKNAQAAKSILDAQGTGAWYASPRGPVGHADPDLSKAIRKLVLAGDGITGSGTGSGLSGAQKEARKRKKRIEEREGTIEGLRGDVQGAGSTLGKQGALWKLIKAYGMYGEYDKGEKPHVLDKVRRAASLANPTAGLPVLQKLAAYLRKNVDISGEEDGDELFSERIEKVQKKGNSKAAKRRDRIFKRIERRGVDYPLKGAILNADDTIAFTAELLGNAEREHGAEWSLGGAELSEEEIAQQVALNKKILGLQDRKQSQLGESLSHVGGLSFDYLKLIAQAEPKNSPLNWKLGAFKKGYANARSTLADLTDNLHNLSGLTGKSGERGDTVYRLRELGSTVSSQDAASSEKDSEIAALLRASLAEMTKKFTIAEAQIPVFERYMPKFHDGGVYSAPVGKTEGPALLRDGELILTPEQQMGGMTMNLYVNGVRADSSQVRMEIENVNRDRVRQVRTGNAGSPKFRTAGLRNG